jgi:hypothetical protein
VALHPRGAAVRAPDAEQWWLAELDRYGNPKLVDGSHTERHGAEEAMRIIHSLETKGFLGASPDRFKRADHVKGFAVVRVEMWRVKDEAKGR